MENEYVLGHVGITQIRVLFWVLKCEKKEPLVCLVLSTQEANVQRRAVGFRGTAFFKYPRGECSENRCGRVRGTLKGRHFESQEACFLDNHNSNQLMG